MKYSKFIVALVILLNTVFTAAVLYVFLRVGSEHPDCCMVWVYYG